MKKIILTESQAKNLVGKVINEQSSNIGNYFMPVICDFEYYHVTYKQQEILSISKTSFNLSFDIDIESRKYGIKGIYVGGFRGPSQLELELEYLPDNDPDKDPMETTITVPIDWQSQVSSIPDDTLDYFGIDEDVEIYLGNDQDGNIIVKNIELRVQSF